MFHPYFILSTSIKQCLTPHLHIPPHNTMLQMVRMRVALVITRRKPGRDYAYPHIKESLTSLLVGHGCPLVISEINNCWRVEGAMVQLLEWFGGGDYDRMALIARYEDSGKTVLHTGHPEKNMASPPPPPGMPRCPHPQHTPCSSPRTKQSHADVRNA